MTRHEVLFELYGPEALQYIHGVLYEQDHWTVAPDRSVQAQAEILTAPTLESDSLLSL